MQLFRLGADVRCADGECGQIRSLVVSPGEDAVTHLVVEPAHRQGLGKLVPLSLVGDGTARSAAGGEVRLHCTQAEFGDLEPAESTYFFPGSAVYPQEPVASWPYYVPPGGTLPGALNTPGREVTQVVTVDTVPDQLPGEDEVYRGDQVHATDGDIGHVEGIAVDTGTGRVLSVLLREGHLWGRRTVLIPRSAVAEVDSDGFHLSITREQVRNLPPASVS